MAVVEPEADGEESGSAMIEFVFLVLLLMVPLVYLVVASSQLQAASYAAVGAADHAAKVFVAAPNPAAGRAAAHDAVTVALGNMGIAASRADIDYSCSAACLSPGSTVTVSVRISTVLPFLPDGIALNTGHVGATATHRIDRFG